MLPWGAFLDELEHLPRCDVHAVVRGVVVGVVAACAHSEGTIGRAHERGVKHWHDVVLGVENTTVRRCSGG
jgi:hypothetical protein